MKKQITFLVLILAMGVIVAGCEKKQIQSENNQVVIGDSEQNQEMKDQETTKDNLNKAEEEKKESQLNDTINKEVDNINISSWDTYNSKAYNFEIKYPSDWTAEEEVGILSAKEENIFILHNEKIILIIQPGENTNINLRDDEVKLDNIEIGNYNTYVAYRDMGLKEYIYRYFFKTEKNNFQLSFSRGDNNIEIGLEDRILIRKIISTIKFK